VAGRRYSMKAIQNAHGHIQRHRREKEREREKERDVAYRRTVYP